MAQRAWARYRVRDTVGAGDLPARGRFYDDELQAAESLRTIARLRPAGVLGLALDDMRLPEGRRVVFVMGRGWGDFGNLRETWTHAPSEVPRGMEDA
jgi:hypothetical protein